METVEATRAADREQTWREIMARWRESGLSQQAFCEREQFKLTTFQYWRRELKRRDGQQESTKDGAGELKTSALRNPVPLFVPVEIAESQSASACEIVLGDGLVIRFPTPCDPGHIAQVVKTLEAR